MSNCLDSHATKYADGNILTPYDATLNQTDIITNKNKFYIMQIIIHSAGTNFSLYTRYGRIGEVGVINYTPGSKQDIINKFKTTFKSKTKNNWIDAFGTPTATSGNDVSKFTKYSDKYFLCQKSLITPVTTTTKVATTAPTVATAAIATAPIVATAVATVAPTVATAAAAAVTETTSQQVVKPLLKPIIKPLITIKKKQLDRRIVSFLELIGNMKMLNAALKIMNIDTEKMPLGQISSEQLDKADKILQSIKDLLTSGKQKDSLEFMTKSSEYYTLVPIVVSRSSRPPVINTMEIIGRYSDKIDELKNLKVAYNTVNAGNLAESQEEKYEKLYKDLKTEITPIEKDSFTWKLIENYVVKTHGSTHRNTGKIEIVNIYEIMRASDKENKEIYQPLDNLQLLWHGTRLGNYISILQNGLVLRPELISNATITGKMFANGIYAANSFSKSLNYCAYSDTNNEACLFLGEFILGNQLEKFQSDSNLSEKILLAQGKHSTWGRGKSTPSSYTTIPSVYNTDGKTDIRVKVPDGALVSSNLNCSLLYDEFIVYNEKQLRLRYIVQVKIH